MAYYKVDSLKITYDEYRRISKGLDYVLSCAAKFLRLRIWLSVGLPGPRGISEMAIAPEEIHPDAYAELSRIAERVVAEGLGLLRFGMVKESLLPRVAVYFADYADPHGRCWARNFISMRGSKLKIVKNTFVVFSRLDGDTFYLTSNAPKEFDGPPIVTVERLLGRTPVETIQAHLSAIENSQRSQRVIRFTSQQELESWMDEYENRCFADALARGRYVELTPKEVEKAREVKALMDGAPRRPPNEPPPLPEADPLIAALQRQLQPKKNPWAGAGILLISVLAFALIGRIRWSPSSVALLIGILFFHELGHYAAMKIFRYKNLRMFFIPLFGAAVSGQKLERAAWKKAIVSILGPGPGIILGFVICVTAMFIQNETIEKLGLLLVAINGFNLLPFLPLDGGWLMQALFFSRNPMAETVFKVAAGVGVILIGFGLRSVPLEILGFFGLVAAPMNYKLARIAREIRKAPRELPPEDGSLAPRLAQQIGERVRTLPGAANLDSVVNLTRQTYEKVIEIPPKWWATVLLSIVYIGLCGMTFLGIGAGLNAQRDRLSAMAPDFVFRIKDFQAIQDGTNTVISGVVRHPTNAPVPGFQFSMKLPPASTNLFSFSRGEFREFNRVAADPFLPGLRKTFAVARWEMLPPSRTNAISFTSALLGTNLTHGFGGDLIAEQFTSERPGDWIVSKIFLNDLEFYFAVNPTDDIGLIYRKDSENGPQIVREFARLFDAETSTRKNRKR